MTSHTDHQAGPGTDEEHPGREAGAVLGAHLRDGLAALLAGDFSREAWGRAFADHGQPGLDALGLVVANTLRRREDLDAELRQMTARLQHDQEVARLAATEARRRRAAEVDAARRAERATAMRYMFWVTLTACAAAGYVGDFDGAAAVLVAFGGLMKLLSEGQAPEREE
jgi:hypothetical protein